jgi:hypothetical protein
MSSLASVQNYLELRERDFRAPAHGPIVGIELTIIKQMAAASAVTR